jgi:hypothetical protein
MNHGFELARNSFLERQRLALSAQVLALEKSVKCPLADDRLCRPSRSSLLPLSSVAAESRYVSKMTETLKPFHA